MKNAMNTLTDAIEKHLSPSEGLSLRLMRDTMSGMGYSGDSQEQIWGVYCRAEGYVQAFSDIGRISVKGVQALRDALREVLHVTLATAQQAREARAARVAAGDTTGVRLQAQVIDAQARAGRIAAEYLD